MKKLRLGLLIPLTALLFTFGASCGIVQSISSNSSKDSSTSESIENNDSSVEAHTHVWSDATCDEPKKCECGETDGEALGHSYTEIKFDENRHWYACVCGVEDGENKEAHYGGTATATELAICEVCSQSYGDLLLPKITSLVIKNTDSAQYDAETKTFTVKADYSGDMPILEVTGKNFDLFSDYKDERTWSVQFARGVSVSLTSGWWMIEENTATLIYDTINAEQLKTEPWEIKYTNDGEKTWIPTGYYVVLETVEVTEVPEITSVVLKNTDSAQYDAETKTFTVKADGSGDMPIWEATGENFNLLRNYDYTDSTWSVLYGTFSVGLTNGWWTIEGNTAILEMPSSWASWFKTELWEIKYTNDGEETWVSTGYYVVLETEEVAKVPEITSLVIKNTDSAQYDAETKTFTVKADYSGDMPILEATGENFDLFSDYNYLDSAWFVYFASGIATNLVGGGWVFEGNTGLYTYSSNDIKYVRTEPWEIRYTNDAQNTWIFTGYYVVLESEEVTEVPEITSVVIKNTDSAQYDAETKTFTIKADGSGDMPILEAIGENFDLLSNYGVGTSKWKVILAPETDMCLTGWGVEGNAAILAIPSNWVSWYSTEPHEIQYTNDNKETWVATGYYIVVETVAGGITNVEELQAAVNAGGTVTLTQDLVLSANVRIDTAVNVTIDLNGFSITEPGVGCGLFDIRHEDAILTIKGEGTLSSNGTAPIYIFEGTLIIENGVTIDGRAYDETLDWCIMLTEDGHVVLNGGTFISGEALAVLCVKTGTCKVNGGTFTYDPSEYVDATTHTVTQNDEGVYIVTAI